MLPAYLYDYLRALLHRGPILFPQPVVVEGFQPTFKQCHLTAAAVEERFCWPSVVGVQFLDLRKLYPWPHVVNRRGSNLVDLSGSADQPFIGFVETDAEELDEFNAIVRAYDQLGRDQHEDRWSDPIAQALSDEFYEKLKSEAITRPVVRIV